MMGKDYRGGGGMDGLLVVLAVAAIATVICIFLLALAVSLLGIPTPLS